VVLGSKEYSPIEISAMILKKIKEDAEERLKPDKVEYATITVPAYFTDRQREATRLAGLKAGLKVQLILDEPTAAAIAFSVDQVKEDEARNIVIYDLGGGTFDVSVLTVVGGVCARLNTEGNMWLGGDNFDHKIMDYVVEKVKEEFGLDCTKNIRFMMELKKKAEKAKIQLSELRQTEINVPGLLQDSKGDLKDVEVEITRAQFEKMIESDVKDSIELVKKALIGAGLTSDQIDNILLVGGSSTIPLVQRALKDTFGDQKILKNIDPMLCVAFGAAIIANRIGENIKCPDCGTTNEGNNSVCSSCGKKLEANTMIAMGTNMPYGIQTEGDRFSEIIPKNSPYPMEQYTFKEFKVPRSHLRRIKVSVYAGENEKASHNNHQFTVWLPLPKGTTEGTKLDVGFLVNENSVVSSVKLKLKDGSGIEKEVFVNRDLGLDGKSERGKIENVINDLKQKIDQNKEDLGTSMYEELDLKYQEVIDALETDNISGAEKKAKEVEEKINNNIKTIKPDWINRSENLIGWADLALSRFGGEMEPDFTYKIKRSIESLKTAINDNQESKALEKYDELNKILDEISPLVLFKMRLLTNSFRASNIGRADLSDKLMALMTEFDNAFTSGDITQIESLMSQALKVFDEIGVGDTEPERGGEGLPQESKYYKSSQ
jgi:molecular chaperone DnaK (HSP70)